MQLTRIRRRIKNTLPHALTPATARARDSIACIHTHTSVVACLACCVVCTSTNISHYIRARLRTQPSVCVCVCLYNVHGRARCAPTNCANCITHIFFARVISRTHAGRVRVAACASGVFYFVCVCFFSAGMVCVRVGGESFVSARASRNYMHSERPKYTTHTDTRAHGAGPDDAACAEPIHDDGAH